MIEAYAFLAMFLVQILAMSVLYPAWFIRHIRTKVASLPTERLAELFPGVDLAQAQERFLTRYRAVNAGIAVLGLLLLGWLSTYLQTPDWDDGPVENVVGAYFMVQALPLLYLVWMAVRYGKAFRQSLLEGKRRAVLQRRGLFDFVSPFTVLLAVLAYILFAAYAIRIEQDPFPGYAGAFINIGIVTLVYALQASVVYGMLYGKKQNPFDTHAARVHAIGMAVKGSVYACIAVVAFLSLNFTLVLLDLQRWEPFAMSVFLVICTLLASLGLIARPRAPDADGLGSSPAH